MSEQVNYDPFAGGDVVRIVPATEQQQEIWTATRIDAKASCAYNAPLLLHFKGKIQHSELLAAYSQLISRHDALRGSFSPDGDNFIVSANIAADLPLIQVSGLDAESKQASIDDIIDTAAATPFDLEFGPLIRSQLLKYSDSEYYLLITVHHIVCDGWSTGILLHELAELYSAEVGRRESNLSPAPSFADYASELNTKQDTKGYLASEDYWLTQYAGEPPVLDLPLDKSRPVKRTFNADRLDRFINSESLKALNEIAASTRCTLFVTLFAVFQLLLWKRSGQTNLVIGFPAAAQPIADNPELIGHCVNLLPIRFMLDGKKTFVEHLKTLRPHIYDALEHQEFGFGSLLKKLNVPRDSSRIPLVPVIFNLETYTDDFNFDGVETTFRARKRSSEAFELFLNIVSYPDKIEFQCSYNTDLFSHDLISKMMLEYEVLIGEIIASPDKPIESLRIITKEDIDLLDHWINETRFEYTGQLIHENFQDVANRFAENTAVIFGNEKVTYKRLNERANQLAQLLISKGITQGDFVGLYVDRSIGMLIALLGVLKSGAAYVPMDPDYPRERIDYIRTAASISCLVTETHLKDELPLGPKDIVICINDNELFQGISTRNPDLSIKPEDIAYVIFTSGSTGKPKGVQVPHRSVTNLIAYVQKLFSFSDQGVLLAISTLCFDISVPELLLPIMSGGVLVIADQDEVVDGNKLSQLIDRHGVSLLDATPTTWRLLLGSEWQGSKNLTAISTGEAMPRDLAENLLAKTGEVWNMYGPTETTVWSTCYRIHNAQQPILIGKPIGNTQCFVLDDAHQLLPIGVPGELFIGGAGVSAGYLNRDDLTAERFIDSPNGDEQGQRLYRTGDLVRWHQDGNLEYLHRLDHQVKVRGNRIELEEIEVVISSHAAVKQCVVEVREDRPGDQRLIAYVVLAPGTKLLNTEMREQARAQLPDYMVPQHLVELDKFPLTPNGKVDRKALPAPTLQHSDDKSFKGAETDLEKYLAKIWSRVFLKENIGVYDNFFEIGGHSLLAIQIVNTLSSDLDTEIPLKFIFEHPCILDLAQAIEKQLIEELEKTSASEDAKQ